MRRSQQVHMREIGPTEATNARLVLRSVSDGMWNCSLLSMVREGRQSRARKLTPIADKAMRLCDRLHRPLGVCGIGSLQSSRKLGPHSQETASKLPLKINQNE